MLQERRHTPKELSDAIPHYIDSDMPRQYADFFAGLSYLPLATLDHQGRPWVSLLVTQSDNDPSVGIQVADRNTTNVVAETNPHDPFLRAVSQDPASDLEARLFAGVGVDFSNRRRNKIAGSIRSADVEGAEKIRLQLLSDQHLGNCPKYITVRSLEHTRRSSELIHEGFDVHSSALPDEAKSVVARASTVFLATKHTSDGTTAGARTDMGVNHRGGAPGFTRLYEENEGSHVTTYLVLPDHSGNRFYQSLGNIETDPQVGLVFPDFATGEILYITGDAENLLGDDADALMPRASLLTRIKVTGAVFVRGGLNLKLASQEQLSPYNPPIKYLRAELEQMGHAIETHEAATPLAATLVATKPLSSTISTFEFALSAPIKAPLPGGFGVFDFSDLVDAGYSHMNETNPQLVNEDYVRTWTLSGGAKYDEENNAFRTTNRVSVTVKRKPGGLMSNVLHTNAEKLITHKLPAQFKGTGAGFSCFSEMAESSRPKLQEKMLWIAGGVGITPFMAMWDGIKQVAKAYPQDLSTDIVLLYSGRDDDIAVLQHFAEQNSSVSDQVTLHIVTFQSAGENPLAAKSARDDLYATFTDQPLKFEERRMQSDDIQSVAHIEMRDVYMCGPEAMMISTEAALNNLGIEEARRHRETFVF
ncbi:pyridoxamine 5'-phosphate oxidase family protein [uncultured Roseovarius sp.]|uniref:pyridoxamine 5'-phosphate oxidase family protein n=1 Tax=uncultured Roseovarius sp. TaxID=293344 RepID=UPI0026267E06|nr:pyridoxamine 5'-phosphate oxidase family protein [uncultured Roseovarius sp.]